LLHQCGLVPAHPLGTVVEPQPGRVRLQQACRGCVFFQFRDIAFFAASIQRSCCLALRECSLSAPFYEGAAHFMLSKAHKIHAPPTISAVLGSTRATAEASAAWSAGLTPGAWASSRGRSFSWRRKCCRAGRAFQRLRSGTQFGKKERSCGRSTCKRCNAMTRLSRQWGCQAKHGEPANGSQAHVAAGCRQAASFNPNLRAVLPKPFHLLIWC